MNDLRLASAMHIMLSLAYAVREGVDLLTSTELARGLSANPALVRKLLVPLVRNGLVESFQGKNGGVRIAKPAREITLRAVYEAVSPDKKVFFARMRIEHICAISSNIESIFSDLSNEMEDALLQVLSQHTVQQYLDEIVSKERKRSGARSLPNIGSSEYISL